ncbi:hypothetical protein Tco_1194991 [Tanacetum coccineum]
MYVITKALLPYAATMFKLPDPAHLDIRFTFIKEHEENGVTHLTLSYYDYQWSGLFTKALGRERSFNFLTTIWNAEFYAGYSENNCADEVDE